MAIDFSREAINQLNYDPAVLAAAQAQFGTGNRMFRSTPAAPGSVPPGSGPYFPLPPAVPAHNFPVGSLAGIGGDKFSRTGRGFAAGAELGNAFFFPGAFGRVQDTLDPAMAEILAQTRSNALGRTPYSQLALDLLGANAALSGRDPLLDQLIQRRKEGLEGFDARENAALREQATAGVNRSLQTGLRAAGLANAGSGIRGGIGAKALRPVFSDFAEASRGLNRDLFLANIEEKNRRQAGLEDLIRGVTNEEAQRRLAAFQGFGQANLATEQFELGKLQDYRAATQSEAQNILNRQIFNLGQNEKERTAAFDTLMGLGAFGSALDQQQQIYDLGLKQIAAARELKPLTSISFGGLPGVPGFVGGALPNMAKPGTLPAAGSPYYQPSGFAPGGFMHPGMQGLPLARFL